MNAKRAKKLMEIARYYGEEKIEPYKTPQGDGNNSGVDIPKAV